jgi:arabinofuranosyltransferase
MSLSSPVRYGILVVIALFTVCIYWLLYDKPLIGIDDANIYFQYVRNAVDGYGFVYFRGADPVEGFTSFLWVLLITPLGYTGYLELSVLVFNFMVFLIILAISVNFINRLTRQNRFISTPVFLFLATLILIPGYVEWVVLTLMETGLWSLLLVSLTILVCQERIGRGSIITSSILLFLLVWTRPESIVFGVMFIGLIAFRLYVESGALKPILGRVALPALAFIIALAALVIIRLSYFGYPLPNTYYAKVSNDKVYNLLEGLKYFANHAVGSPLFTMVLIAIAASGLYLIHLIIRQWKSNGRLMVEYCISIVSIAVPVYVGGDHFKFFRLFQPFIPIYLFMLLNFPFWSKVFSIRWTSTEFRLPYPLIVLFVLPLIYALSRTPLHNFTDEKSPLDWEFRLAEMGRKEGEQLNALFGHLKELPTVGVSAAGGIAYTYNGEIVDLMGLNNEKMAHATGERVGTKNHAAFNKRTFYELAPDIFHGYSKLSYFTTSTSDTTLLENKAGFLDSFASNMYKDIFDDQDFRNQYKRVIIAKPKDGLFLKTFCKASYIQTLERSGLEVFPLTNPTVHYVVK